MPAVVMGCNPEVAELGSGIEMRLPCRTNHVEAFTRKNEYNESLLLAALGLSELNMV